VPPAGAGLVVGRFTARPAGAGASLGRSLGRSLASSLVARASAAFAAYAGSASSAPALQACGYRLCLPCGVVFYFLPQACLPVGRHLPEFTPHRASLWYGGGLLRFEQIFLLFKGMKSFFGWRGGWAFVT